MGTMVVNQAERCVDLKLKEKLDRLYVVLVNWEFDIIWKPLDIIYTIISTDFQIIILVG